MKFTKFNILTLFMTVLFMSCNIYPDSVTEVVMDGYRINNSESGKITYYEIRFRDLNDELSSYTCSNSSSPSNIEDAFIHHIIDKVKHIHQDSVMIMKVDFDKFQILEANRIIAKKDIDSIALSYHASRYDKPEKTKEQIELEKSQLHLKLMNLLKWILLVSLCLGLFKLIPKLIFLAKCLNKKSSVQYELDRRRRNDEREIKTRIISELKSQGYDEKSIKEVYDELSKNM